MSTTTYKEGDRVEVRSEQLFRLCLVSLTDPVARC